MLTKVLRLWRKARGRGLRFLVWKAAERLHRRARKYTHRFRPNDLTDERVARLFGASPDSSIQQQFLNGSRPCFFIQQDEVDALVEKMQAEDKNYAHRLQERADKICNHCIEILSMGEMELGERIDWHRDYVSGLSWDKRYFNDYDFFDLTRPSDVRTVWELNRLHFLVTLGQAYRVTQDEKYVRKIMEIVCDWDDANPYEHSINWTCAMDAAIRAINLMWTLQLVLPSSSLDDQWITRLLRLLLQHGRYIRHNLEYSDVRQNHYLSDIVGLVFLGLYLPESSEAQDWLRYALPQLETEMQHQIYSDGVAHEGSVSYHRLVVELFLSSALFLRLNGHELSPEFWERLEKMLEFVQSYVQPDGLCPLFGDTDDGRLWVLGDQRVNDHRYLLVLGAVTFNRADFAASAGLVWEEAAWIIGIEGWQKFEKLLEEAPLKPEKSKAFQESGFYFLRHDDDYAAIDCGDVGLRGRGGHGHCDTLSFVLSLQGESIVVDRGNSRYTSSKALREEVIEAGSHNTILIDGHDYARILKYDIATVSNTPNKVLDWIQAPEKTIFDGEHYGYLESVGITHRRRLELENGRDCLIIRDELRGPGQHQVTARFYLHPDCSAQVEGDGCVINTPQGRLIHVTAGVKKDVIEDGMANGKPGASRQGEWVIKPTTVFPRYGWECKSFLMEWQATLALPCVVEFCWETKKQ